jgi:hypothetical protein
MTDFTLDDLREQVAQHIQTAFADTPYPGDERVAAYARHGDSIAEALVGQHWSEVNLDVLYQHRWEIFLLTPETFRFYVPVVMLAALYHREVMGSLADNLIFSLTPQREEHVRNYFNGDYRDYFSRRAAEFNHDEKQAVLAFVTAFPRLSPGRLVYDIDIPTMTIPFWERA